MFLKSGVTPEARVKNKKRKRVNINAPRISKSESATIIVKYCETNFCLSKIRTRFAKLLKPELKRQPNVLSLHEIVAKCCYFAIEYVTNCK